MNEVYGYRVDFHDLIIRSITQGKGFVTVKAEFFDVHDTLTVVYNKNIDIRVSFEGTDEEYIQEFAEIKFDEKRESYLSYEFGNYTFQTTVVQGKDSFGTFFSTQSNAVLTSEIEVIEEETEVVDEIVVDEVDTDVTEGENEDVDVVDIDTEEII